MQWFCPNCEILGKAIMVNSRDGKFNCADCMLALDFEITVQPQKTYEQVTLDFEKIPLTDKKAVLAAKRKKSKV
jgi:hypothetical protein